MEKYFEINHINYTATGWLQGKAAGREGKGVKHKFIYENVMKFQFY